MRAEQSRAEQSRAEQSRAEQSRAEQSRAKWIDACRGIGILFVVLGHCSPPLNKYVYGWHMAFFSLLSGYLYKQHNSFLGAVRMYAKRYLLPYFVLCFINLVINCAIEAIRGVSNTKLIHYMFGIVYSRGSTLWMPNCSPLWFLTALFMALVFYELLQHAIKNSKIQHACVFVSSLISYVLYYIKAPKLPWNIDTALMMLLFIAIGDAISKIDKKVSVPGCIFLGGAGIVSIYLNPVVVNFDNNEYGNYIYMVIGAIAIGVMLIEMSKNFFARLEIGYLEYLGRHTLFIMGFDYLTGTVSTFLLYRINMLNWASLFIFKMIILTVGLLIWYKIISIIPNKYVKELLRY